jgi:hypothetical protein
MKQTKQILAPGIKKVRGLPINNNKESSKTVHKYNAFYEMTGASARNKKI